MHDDARRPGLVPCQRGIVSKSLAFALSAACMVHVLRPAEARADASSWLSAGGGYGVERTDSRNAFDRATAMSFAIGVGTDPTRAVVFGGLLRSTTFFTLGTDLGLAARVATGGFARGQWGLALDAGPAWRMWGGGDYGRFPLRGMLYLGAPWGLQLGVGGDYYNLAGVPYARGLVALLEVDLLRLTVMRQGGTDRWWENPSPAGGSRAPEPR